jgi:hypothetical protein
MTLTPGTPTPATVSAPNPTATTRSPRPSAAPARSTPPTESDRTVPPLRDDNRDDIETTTPCPTRGTAFTPIRRQRYYTPAYRQSAYRARHPAPQPPPPTPPAASTPRRDITVYRCPECDVRYLGRQWCDVCNRPCIRLDYGGLCPHCSEPVPISDLTDQYPTRQTKP